MPASVLAWSLKICNAYSITLLMQLDADLDRDMVDFGRRYGGAITQRKRINECCAATSQNLGICMYAVEPWGGHFRSTGCMTALSRVSMMVWSYHAHWQAVLIIQDCLDVLHSVSELELRGHERQHSGLQ